MSVLVTPAYGIDKLDKGTGVEDLRKMFPDAKTDPLNFCMFSTSGTHGSYTTIEEIEEALDKDGPQTLTVLVVQPRTVRMLYGDIWVTADDIEFLKALRASSKSSVLDWYEE
ncbi:hypothetical protein [Rhizobium leguminosarum]|uniref:hypothetical protein n=1 Tax=Rhizobium leguminosarum TaxID=384 RepID=UPI000B92AFE2|nr:hypothetical protein [Rhizobium leguminosarum]ASS55925.1 hypothetical protein CHR56_15885 [Rhizobium leguminosarum bv. viciae]